MANTGIAKTVCNGVMVCTYLVKSSASESSSSASLGGKAAVGLSSRERSTAVRGASRCSLFVMSRFHCSTSRAAVSRSSRCLSASQMLPT